MHLARTEFSVGGSCYRNSSRSENLAVANFDLFSLRFDSRWIAFHQLDCRQRCPRRPILHKCMERAQARGVNQELLRLEAEEEALKQACRIGMGRALENAAGRGDQRLPLGRADRPNA